MDLQGWFQVEAAENRKLRSYHFMLLFGVGYREREREREKESSSLTVKPGLDQEVLQENAYQIIDKSTNQKEK